MSVSALDFCPGHDGPVYGDRVRGHVGVTGGDAELQGEVTNVAWKRTVIWARCALAPSHHFL